MGSARFLDLLEPEARAAFDRLGTWRSFEPGTTVCIEGERGGNVVVIHAGRAKVFATGPGGQEFVLAVRGPGDVLGDFSAIDGGPRSASATAMEPLEAQMIPGGAFRQFLAGTPGAGLALLTSIVARLRDADRLRVEFGARDTLGRVALRLVELAEEHGVDERGADERAAQEGRGGTVRIAVPLTQDDLAGWVAASRESVARALASLRRRGIVTTARRDIRVLDLERLRDETR